MISDIIDIFLVKVLILTLCQYVMTNDILLQLYDKSENQRESIEEGYLRYIRGQYGVDLEEENLDPAKPSFANELANQIF